MKRWQWLLLAAFIVSTFAGGEYLYNEAIVRKFAEAISVAEGWPIPNSRPRRNNNPGNLTYDFGYANIGKDSIYIVFATAQDGWNALFEQVKRAFANTSHIYNRSMSIREFATHYTATEQDAWAVNVANHLGVTPDTRLEELT